MAVRQRLGVAKRRSDVVDVLLPPLATMSPARIGTFCDYDWCFAFQNAIKTG